VSELGLLRRSLPHDFWSLEHCSIRRADPEILILTRFIQLSEAKRMGSSLPGFFNLFLGNLLFATLIFEGYIGFLSAIPYDLRLFCLKLT
jgi:hypothetical protein